MTAYSSPAARAKIHSHYTIREATHRCRYLSASLDLLPLPLPGRRGRAPEGGVGRLGGLEVGQGDALVVAYPAPARVTTGDILCIYAARRIAGYVDVRTTNVTIRPSSGGP